MVRNFAVCYLAAVSTLLISGCSSHQGDAPAPTVESTTPAPETTPAPPTEAPPEPASELPPCGDIGTTAMPSDCQLQSRDPLGVTFEVRHTGSPAHLVTTVTLLDPGGAVVQTLVEPEANAPGAVAKLRDLDGNGRDELVIPIFLATANMRYAIYHASGNSLEYHRAGELAGIGIDTSATGYVVVSARTEYASWDVEFWKFAADDLTPIVTAQVRPIDDGTGKVAGTTCAVIDSGGLETTGLTPAQADTQFCAEPAVARVRRN
ncbi:MAG: hypothetical protein JWN03_5339 [Nocardia sp.]|uniref:hypothetical protein n=1 Tax=Nocardia sp. TaxID=1821 RepID=UPI0026055359|nr:hypothetical protein [Nocardia sp.]MCU1645064.1 hypothetical protein [Nocardia sp.]